MSGRLRASVLVLALVVPTEWIYASGLDRAPVYLASDEVKFGLQAHALASHGTDVAGHVLPCISASPDSPRVAIR